MKAKQDHVGLAGRGLSMEDRLSKIQEPLAATHERELDANSPDTESKPPSNVLRQFRLPKL